MKPSIVFTGGGTAGHVTPNLALITLFKAAKWDIAYVGSDEGIEKEMIEGQHIPFYAVKSGKLRRYFSLKNLLDPFKILVGIVQSIALFYKLKPDVVFSKGGFVAFPVVVGAWYHRIPVIAHESDMSPGLANRLSYPFVNRICLSFEASVKYFKTQKKVAVTGTPIRQQLFNGNSAKGLAHCGFNTEKPCLLVIGGSLGANSINRAVRSALVQLLKEYQVIHLCGKGKIDPAFTALSGYCQIEYADTHLPDLFAAASIVVSRAGANSLYELLALSKPHVLIPLSAKASRGDQIQNAHYFQKAGISVVIKDEALTAETLIQALSDVKANEQEIVRKMNELGRVSAAENIMAIIKEEVNQSS